MDGLDLRDFTNKLLEALASPVPESTFDWSSAATLPKLTPGIDEALNVPLEATPERTKNTMEVLKLFADNRPSMAFKTKTAKLPGACSQLQVTLSEEESEVIIQGCKSRGITVTSGVHAALILAGQKLAQPPADENARYIWSDLQVISLRKYLPPPLDSQNPVTIYHTGLPATLDVLTDDQAKAKDTEPLSSSSFKFSHVASSLNRFYRRNHKTDSPSLFDYMAQWVNAIVAVYTAPPGPDGPSPPAAMPNLSAVGVLEDRLSHTYKEEKQIELKEWCTMIEVVDTAFFCWVLTFRGRITVTAVHNDAFYETEFAEKVMQEWLATARRELA